MIDWTVVGAEENEETGTMHLLMRSGETVSVRPSLKCAPGLGVFVGEPGRAIPVSAALEAAGSRVLLMHTDDFEKLLERLDVWRFFNRARSVSKFH